MGVTRRELRVRLRSDRVGHQEVMDWLDAMDRNEKGVEKLTERIVAVLVAHARNGATSLTTPEKMAERRVKTTRPTPPVEVSEQTGAVATPVDPLRIAAARMEF
jgi:hypothetical protein